MKQPLPDFFDDDSCSSTDCTGLIPSAPRDDDERKNYETLYKFLPPKNRFESTIKSGKK